MESTPAPSTDRARRCTPARSWAVITAPHAIAGRGIRGSVIDAAAYPERRSIAQLPDTGAPGSTYAGRVREIYVDISFRGNLAVCAANHLESKFLISDLRGPRAGARGSTKERGDEETSRVGDGRPNIATRLGGDGGDGEHLSRSTGQCRQCAHDQRIPERRGSPSRARGHARSVRVSRGRRLHGRQPVRRRPLRTR